MFLAHQNDLKPGEWLVLPQANETKTLVNRNGSYDIEHNLCLHQGTKLRQGRGSGLDLVCPMHRWSWDADGKPTGDGVVGHSKGSTECSNQHNIPSIKSTNWSGFLFEGPVQLGVDISGDYEQVEYRLDMVDANFIPIMNLCLDVDHNPVAHPNTFKDIGLDDTKNIEWRTWDGGSAQLVRGTPMPWESKGNKQTTFNAIWLALYPFTFVRYQPGAVMVTILQPYEENLTKVHVFKYRDNNYGPEVWEINNRVLEQAWAEDKETVKMSEPGWRFHINNLEQEKLALKDFLTKAGLA